MNQNLPTTNIGTSEYLTVGRLLEKLQFEDVNHRVCVCVENEEGKPPALVTLLVSHPDGNLRDLFVWVPGATK